LVDKLTTHLTKEEFGAVIGAIKEQRERLEEHAVYLELAKFKDEKSLEETKSAIERLTNAEIKFTKAWSERVISGVACILKEIRDV